jgi:hypothetical protein
MHACILAFAFSFKYSLLPEIHVFIQAQLNFFPDGLYIAFVFFVCFSTKDAPVAGKEAHNMHHERAGGRGELEDRGHECTIDHAGSTGLYHD